MQQMLTVTYDNEEVFALNLQAELPQSLKMEASSGNKQMLFQFSGARYSLDANAPGNSSNQYFAQISDAISWAFS